MQWNLIFIYNSKKKEGNPDICHNMVEPGGSYTKWNEPDKDKACLLTRDVILWIRSEELMVITIVDNTVDISEICWRVELKCSLTHTQS